MNKTSPLRILFAGTPAIAATVLQALLEQQRHVVAVYTQPDRPAGRGRRLHLSPVKELAQQYQLPIEQPTSLKSLDAQQTLQQYQADVMVVVAYGLILPQAVLDIPKYGCINVHVSLLPRWRGAAPIQHAILAGDKTTGVTIMQMDAGLDTGPVLLQRSCDISATETSGSLHDKLASLGADGLIETLDLLVADELQPQTQPAEGSTYAAKITKEQAAIDWTQAADNIALAIRAYNPWPIAYSHYKDTTIRIWEAEVTQGDHTEAPGTIVKADNKHLWIQTGDGLLALNTIQLPGAKALPIQAVMNGKPDFFQINTAFTL